MPDEFENTLQPQPPSARAAGRARLVARLFVAAGVPLRARLLRCLLRPLSTLGAAGVAAGAFAAFADARASDAPLDTEAVARLSGRQVHELAHFVEQVDPQALEQFVNLASGSPLAMATTFSAAALLLLVRRLQPALRPRDALRPPA